MLERAKEASNSRSCRRQHCTIDSLVDLASFLEEARATCEAAHVIFLEIRRAFDALSHEAPTAFAAVVSEMGLRNIYILEPFSVAVK